MIQVKGHETPTMDDKRVAIYRLSDYIKRSNRKLNSKREKKNKLVQTP